MVYLIKIVKAKCTFLLLGYMTFFIKATGQNRINWEGHLLFIQIIGQRESYRKFGHVNVKNPCFIKAQ